MVKKAFHTGTVKKIIKIKASKEKVWGKISNIAGLPTWVADVKTTTYLSKKKKGIGAVRLITFEDNHEIEEHIVRWEKGEYFTYIATKGLPLRAYVATISMAVKSKNLVELTWQSYLNSEKMSKREFLDFVVFLRAFYETSLKNLKIALDKK